jgi:transcription elongation factor GreA
MKYLSSQKLRQLKKELEQLKEERKEASKRVQEAQDRGDISESAEYTEAKESQAFNEGRIQEVERVINEAVIIPKNRKCDSVNIGCQVIVKNNQGERKFTIVGSQEADPAQGKISNESPLGRAFLGKKKDDEVKIQTPKGSVHYKILQIK